MTVDNHPTHATLPAAAVPDRVAAFLNAVYGWMFTGLALTAGTAWFIAHSPAVVQAIASNRFLFWALFAAQLGIVFVLAARVQTLAASAASLLFVLYSVLTGVTLSFVLLLYTGESVATTFIVSAGMFGGLAVYGTVTTRNLAGLRQFLFMGLLGVVIASVVGVFWQSDGLQFVLSFIGVIVFSGLTVYDAQRLKDMAASSPASPGGAYPIVGALTLYLDFVNLFLFLLRFTGNRRE